MATLLKGEKRQVSAQLKTEINRKTGQQQLHELLDIVLNPNTLPESKENLDWCQALIAGGSTFEEFARTVRQYDNASTCGLVWTSNFVAYRCRTCGISPCMSICADCFHGGDHTDHDFNMFRSQAGGACDCGDPNVMRSTGFCSLHGPDKPKNLTIPADLLSMADVVVPRIVFRFVLYLREIYENRTELPTFRFNLSEGEPLLGLLHELCNMGGAMRSVITRAMTDEQLYKNLNDGSTGCYHHFKSHINHTQGILHSAQSSFTIPDAPDLMRGNPAVTYPLLPMSFVEELLFWAVIYEFPEKMVTLLLKMLPDNSYKEIFTQSFVKFYGRIAMSVASSSHPEKLSSRVVHISVQLFSNEDLAIQMTEELQLIHILIVSLQSLLKRTLMDNHMRGVPGNWRSSKVVDCGHPVMHQHCYWPVISDFTNILSHRSVVDKFFMDPGLVKMWTSVLAMFMCMNMNERQIRKHIEYEPHAYSIAFSAEIEACAAPMWQLYTHCKDEATLHYTQAILTACTETIDEWIDPIDVYHTMDPYQVSFHIPLIRYYALFLSQAVIKQGLSALPSRQFLTRLMNYPLQIQAIVGEISCGLWVRNGLQIKRQAITYMQCHFCASMIDLDLFLLQVCAAQLDPNHFIDKVFSCFKVVETLTFNQSHMNSHLEADKESAMLESALDLIVTLLSTRTYMGSSEEELLRQEMVCLLCMHDTTHSRLTDQIPEKTGLFTSHDSFEPILAEIADYHCPMSESGSGGLQQGRYSPKPSIWETEFDPVHVQLRVMQKKDFQSAMDRYSSHMKQTGRHCGSSDLWPPFQPLKPPCAAFKSLYQLLHCKALHAAVYIILYKAVHGKSISEHVLYLCIALLDMMLQTSAENISPKTPTTDVVQDGDFGAMFPDNLILSNLSHRINTVEIPIVAVYEKPSIPRQHLEEEVSIFNPGLFGIASGFLEDLEGMEEEMFVHEEVAEMQAEGLDGVEEGEVDIQQMEVVEGVEFDVDTPAASGGQASVQSSLMPTTEEPSASCSTSTQPARKAAKLSTVLWTPSKMVNINETMLELLVKLHSKMAGKEGSYAPPSAKLLAETQTGSKHVQVGGGQFYIKRLLDKICHMHPESQKQLEELCQCKEQPKAGKEETDAHSSVADRRKKARAAQQKLFAKLAAEQMKFLEKSLETEDSSLESASVGYEDEAAQPVKAADREVYECVICGQAAPSTSDKPIGMVALMQPTGVVGHQSQVLQVQNLPTSDSEAIPKANLFRSVNQQRKVDLLSNFAKSSVLTSVNIGWHGGVHIQSCRHCIHLSCHESYIKSLRQDYQSPQLHVRDRGEYECPLCRQLANFVLPCLPSVERPATRQASPDSLSHARVTSQLKEDLALCRGDIPDSMKDIIQAAKRVFIHRLLKEHKLKELRPTCEDSELINTLLRSTARVNLELDVVARDTLLVMSSSYQLSNRRSCIGTLLELLSLLIDKTNVTTEMKLWSMLTEVQESSQSRSRGLSNEVPVLLKDPITLLIHMVLAIKQPMHRDHFKCIVRVLYASLYVQALSVISCKMPSTERQAWSTSGMTCQDHSSQIQLQSLLHQVITMYSESKLYEDSDMIDGRDICQSVWTLQCIETAVQHYCLPFLRTAALIQHHLFREELPTCQSEDLEFEVLINFLHLCTLPSANANQTDVYSTRCLYFAGNPSEFLTSWCKELLVFVKKRHRTAKSLLLYNPTFYPPRLLQLPEHYDVVFQYYRELTCERCKTVPNRPAVCLVCGSLLCLNGARLGCHITSALTLQTEQHSLSCGAGTAVYLDINSSAIIIIRGERMCYWASVYLDRHGEEDRELKRGKPLFLCHQRYKVLEHLWRNHSFNHCCKDWLWHGAANH